VIYLDTSVALAHLLGETRVPPARLWQAPLVSSRLLEYEVWTQIHTRKLGSSHAEAVRSLLGEVALVEMLPPVLARAVEPFPLPVRTLDALHLATLEFLTRRDRELELASYDTRLLRAARSIGVKIFAP
jgi:predicted nucleic acid-binding protein